ncbi:MAG: ComEC/Rec2 family competence protein [bacterium]|nr:ComEC/Rec2 family competence protein [bacterium]
MGRYFGWGMFAVLFGVALRSTESSFYIPPWFWMVSFFCFVTVFLCISALQFRIVVCLVFAFVFGMWRVDVAPRPHLRRIDGRAFLVRTQVVDVWTARRNAVTARIAPHFSPDETALVAGILYGDADFSKTAKDRFVSSGLMHVVAVSGSNVTILIRAISLILLFFGLHRRHAFFLSSGSLILFTLFVGIQPSVLRAGLMAWAVLIAREIGHPTSAFRLLLTSAFILIMWNPWQLLFDVSFALSFLAMWGVLAWTPIFTKWFWFLPTRFSLREIASMTASATLMTAPYLAWAFGRLSLAGLITNLFALPLVLFIMAGGAIVAVLGTMPFASVVAVPLQGFVRAMYFISRLAEAVPWLDLGVQSMTSVFCVSAYLLLIFLWISVRGDMDEGCGKVGIFFGRVSID